MFISYSGFSSRFHVHILCPIFIVSEFSFFLLICSSLCILSTDLFFFCTFINRMAVVVSADDTINSVQTRSKSQHVWVCLCVI